VTLVAERYFHEAAARATCRCALYLPFAAPHQANGIGAGPVAVECCPDVEAPRASSSLG
jgi:hypothetical protein